MKTPSTNDRFQQDNEQSVRVIKAAQASKIFGGAGAGHAHAPTDGQRKP